MSTEPVRLSAVVARLDAAGLLRSAPADDPLLAGVTADSREVGADDLFCARVGTATDAHDYVPAADRAGAAAALVERRVPDGELPQVIVTDGRRAAAVAAARVFGDPATDLTLVGVTGTNGKSTTVFLLRHLLAAREPAAAIGTLGAVLEHERLPGGEAPTTPGPVELARILRDLVDRGIRAVALEVSSHALDQRRVAALEFDAAVFTNLSREHLEYHGSEEAYAAAKRSLVQLLGPDGAAVVNAEEPAWDGLIAEAPRGLGFCVADATCDVRALDLAPGPGGTSFRLEAPGGEARVELPLIGRFNVRNALGAAAACLALGFDLPEVVERLETAPQVPGRLERVAESPCPVLIDYAHTPDALAQVLGALRPLASGRVIVVFGAGGERDRGKRPFMGEAAQAHADVVVVTSDNPRSEDPDRIIDEIIGGMEEGNYVREVDRRRAIARTLDLARGGDIVLLAGKGHETVQKLAGEVVPFDERRIVNDWLREREAAHG